jgi:hypothetical protein
MRVFDRSRVNCHPRGGKCLGGWSRCAAILVVLLVALVQPSSAGAQAMSPAKSHSLGVNLTFPDTGLAQGEQLCLALFAGKSPDLAKPPLLSRCLDPGDASASFEGLPSGEYSVLLPGPGSKLAPQRYRGQLVTTSIPDDDRLDAYGIDVNVALAPDFAGTTGRVQVNVFGCPAGTNAGNDKDSWAAECPALAGGVPLTLTGTGSIEDAGFRGVTGVSGDRSGRVEFSDLPPGAYELDGDLPDNVTDSPALFVESSIDGSLGSLDPNKPLALRPTETVAVDVYLVLDQDHAADNPGSVGLSDVAITGGTGADEPDAAGTPEP